MKKIINKYIYKIVWGILKSHEFYRFLEEENARIRRINGLSK